MAIIVPGKDPSLVETGKKILIPCQAYLPSSEFKILCQESEYTWRPRLWGPLETFWSCILKHLDGVKSVRSMEHHLGSLQDEISGSRRDGADFCRARQRLPQIIFEKALAFIEKNRPSKGVSKVFGMVIVFVDGFTSKVFDSKENRNHFGYSLSRNGLSRLPIIRAVMAVCGDSGTVLKSALGPYKTSEQHLFNDILKGIGAGMLVVGDRHFCSFPILWSLLEKGAHGLFRKHQTRKGHFFKSLGYKDTLMRWPKNSLKYLRCAAWKDLRQRVFEDLYVRHIERVIVRKGYRSFTLKLCTTLLDPKKYPANQLIELYLKRWQIEGDILRMKSNHGLRRLHGKTPDVVYKEMLSGMIAHSLVCNIKAETGEDPRRLSNTQTCRILRTISERMVEASAERRITLAMILKRETKLAEVPVQKRPPEPRFLVSKPTRFKILRKSRTNWKKWHKSQLTA